jgi:RNA polymerase sigma factor for flagellar operon FliA
MERKMTDTQFYPSKTDQVELSELLRQYSPLIKRICDQIKFKVVGNIELDDLLQSGTIGLLEAKASFSEAGGASFKTYATMKIRYAIYDGLRKHTNITREISQDIKRIKAAISSIQHEKSATSNEIASAIGVSQQQYSQMMEGINAYKTISIEEDRENIANIADDEQDPMYLVGRQKLKASIGAMLKQFSSREQTVLALYYNEFLGFREIGEILQLTEARVSQIHSQLLSKLKNKLLSRNLTPQDVF